MIVRELITRLGFRTDEQAVRRYDSALMGVHRTALRVGGALAAVFSVRHIQQTVDEVMSLEGMLKQLPQEIGDSAAAFDRVVDHANNARQSVGAYAKFFIRAGHGTKEFIKDQEQVFQLADAVSYALAAGGATAVEQSQAFFQLGQAIASPTVQMEEMNTVIDTAPQLWQALSDEIVGVGNSLKEAVGKGQVTNRQLAEALMKVGPQFEKQFKELPLTIGQSFTIIGNKFSRVIAKLNRDTKAATHVANGFVWAINKIEWAALLLIRTVDRVAKSMGGWEKVLQAVRAALIALTAYKATTTILALASAFRAAGGAAGFLATMMGKIPIVALFAALALLIDDIWNWVEGNESLLGRLLGPWKEFGQTLREIGASVRKWIGPYIEALRQATKATHNLVVQLGGAAVVVRRLSTGLASLVLGKLVLGLTGVGKAAGLAIAALQAVRFALLRIPVIAVAFAIGMLLDQLWRWATGQETILNRVLPPWNEFKATATRALSAVGRALEPLSRQLLGVQKLLLGAFTGDLSAQLDGLKLLWTGTFDHLENLLRLFLPQWGNLESIAVGSLRGIQGAAEHGLGFVGKLLQFLVRLLTGDFSGALSAFRGMWGHTVGFLEALLGGIPRVFATVVEATLQLLRKLGVNVEPVVRAFRGLSDFIKSVFATDWVNALGWVSKTTGSAFDFARQMSGFLLQALGGLAQFVVGAFLGDWDRAFAGLRDLWDGIYGYITSIIDKVKSMMAGLVPDWMKDAAGGVQGLVKKGKNLLFGEEEPALREQSASPAPQRRPVGERVRQSAQRAREALAPREDRPGVLDVINGALGAFQPPQLAPAAVAGTASHTTSVHKRFEINSKVELQVPPGTTEHQRQFLEREARNAVREQFDRELRRLTSDTVEED